MWKILRVLALAVVFALGQLTAAYSLPELARLPTAAAAEYGDEDEELSDEEMEALEYLVNMALEEAVELLDEDTDLGSASFRTQVERAIWRRARAEGIADELDDEAVAVLAEGTLEAIQEYVEEMQSEGADYGGCEDGTCPIPRGGGYGGDYGDSGAGYADYAQDVLSEVNRNRAEHGLPPLRLQEDLCAWAEIRAQEIMQQFSHTRPNGSSCLSIIRGGYRLAAENIAGGYETAEIVVAEWMDSPGHRANILNPDLRELGVGYYYDGSSYYGHHWVQLFRTR